MGPETRDREARKRAMIDAAIALFSDEGYDGVSTRAVAERAGCSETLLFRYFGGKRGLLLAICNQMSEWPYERLRADEFNDPRAYLEQQLLRMLQHVRENSAAIRIITATIVTDGELASEFERRHDDEVDYVAGQLAHFQRTGAIAPDVDIRAIAAALEQVSFALGVFVQVVYGKPQAELDAIASALSGALSIGMRDQTMADDDEPWRREAVRVALAASDSLGRLLALLGSGEATEPLDSRKAKASARRFR